MNHATEDLRDQEPMKISKESEIFYVQIVDGMIREDLNLTHTTVHSILTNELGMRKICAKKSFATPRGHHDGKLS